MNKKLLEDILELSVDDRVQLVQDIWDSITLLPESLELSEQHRAEIDRRIEKLDRQPESAIDWPTLKGKIGL